MCQLDHLTLTGTTLSVGQTTHFLTQVMQGGEIWSLLENLKLHKLSVFKQVPIWIMENICLLEIDPSIENLGTRLKTLALKNFSFPKVHPNILGPGLAQVNLGKPQSWSNWEIGVIFQVPDLDLSGSRLNDRQWGSLFFSVLDTRKVNHIINVRTVFHWSQLIPNYLPLQGRPPGVVWLQPQSLKLSSACFCRRHNTVGWPQWGPAATAAGEGFFSSIFYQFFWPVFILFYLLGGGGAAEECLCQGPLLPLTWWGSSSRGTFEREVRGHSFVEDEDKVQSVHRKGCNNSYSHISHSVGWDPWHGEKKLICLC